jgi:carbon storage regulator CsrA
MFCTTRYLNQTIFIDDDIRVKILEIRSDRVELGIAAPRSMKIDMQEVKPPPAPPPNFCAAGVYTCPACSEAFKQPGDFRNHMREAHNLEPLNIGGD